MRKTILIGIVMLLTIAGAFAQNCVEPTLITTGDIKNIITGPAYNSSNPSQIYTSATCKISIKRIESGSFVVSQASMESSSDGYHNYSYDFASSGTYPYFINCTQGSNTGVETGCYAVGTSQDDNLNSIITNQNTQYTVSTQTNDTVNTIETGVQNNATDIKVNVTGGFAGLNVNVDLTPVLEGIQNNATNIKENITTETGEIDSTLTTIEATQSSQNTQLTTIETGIQNNQSYLNASISARFDASDSTLSSITSTLASLLNDMWNKVITASGVSFNQTIGQIWQGSSNTSIGSNVWNFRPNSTNCDFSLSINETPQACAELNDLHNNMYGG